MKRVCAWCKRELKPREKYAFDGQVTHGICSLCALEYTNFESRSVRQMLNYLEEPVFLIDAEGRVRTANDAASQATGKSIDMIEDALGGDVFECVYSKLPEGCGKTVHCTACAIRNIVMDTLATGQGYEKIPAFQYIATPDGPKVLRFTVSTEKVGDNILLRIDGIAEKQER